MKLPDESTIGTSRKTLPTRRLRKVGQSSRTKKQEAAGTRTAKRKRVPEIGSERKPGNTFDGK